MSTAWVTALPFPRIQLSKIRYMQTDKTPVFSAVASSPPSLNSGKRSTLGTDSNAIRKQPRLFKNLKVAVVGCAHGELDSIYRAVAEVERKESCKIDLVICPGDFQAVRNETDLQYMACPQRYKDMRSFWKYYAGKSIAPTPTIFVGGNHEAPSHLQEMPLGGLVAPNMYYLGNAGVITFRGLRIAGISGVYVEHGYHKKRLEKPPYERSSIRSVYQTRKEDVDRLMRIEKPVDIFISHDWPRGITSFGNLDQLLKAKPFLASEISGGTFGNPGTMELLKKLQPSFWFAAHMHVKFPAIVPHNNTGRQTKFLALDKVLPRRDFLQILDVPLPDNHGISIKGSEHPSSAGNQVNPELANDADTKHYVSTEQTESADSIEFIEPQVELDQEWFTILRTQENEPNRLGPVTNEEIMETVTLLHNNNVRSSVLLKSDFERRAPIYREQDKQGTRSDKLTLQPKNTELLSALNCPPPDYMTSEEAQLENNVS